jgi:hypothetical protein
LKVFVPVPGKPEEARLQPLLIEPSSTAPWPTIVLPSNCDKAPEVATLTVAFLKKRGW